MAITTYSELQTAAANWMDKTILTTRIPEFIALAEARLNRELRLRTMEYDAALSSSASARTIALPSGFLEPIDLFIDRGYGREKLTFIPSTMETITTEGVPQYWSVDGTNITFERPTDAVYSFTLKMLQAFALSDSTTTNWLLTNYPDLYLAATLAEGFAYLMDDEEAKWQVKAEKLIDDVNRKESRNRSMATLRTDVPLMGCGTFDISRGY